jgi:hypothetical protein
MTTTVRTRQPVGQLFTARTLADVDSILAQIDDMTWRPLGDRSNNYAPVNVGAEPADGWAEKVINGIDAVVEDRIEVARDFASPDPRTAAEKHLNVPGGHVWNVPTDLRRPLAEQLVVTVRAGTDKDPTLVVMDRGIGQHPDAFPTTLLSLNESNKRDKVYLMGAYGWGGASSYAFAAYTVYISRRNPALLTPGQEDRVGWTVVRYNPLADDRFSKTGVYEYLTAPGKNGAPGPVRSFEPSELPHDLQDWHGTVAIMIDYRLGRYSAAAAWEPKDSLYVLGNAILFDPVMPFLLRDERPKSVAGNEANSLRGMVIPGTATKLMDLQKRKRKRDRDEVEGAEPDERVTYSNTYLGRLSSGGAVTIRYWVLGDSGKYKRDWQPTRPYVMPEQAVTITLNGQRHMSYPRALIERAGFMTLSKAMLVHVDTDGLGWQEKRELFSTTRDRLKETAVTEELHQQLSTTLRSDEALRAEDRRRKERALARSSKEQAERIRARLAKAIAALRKGSVQRYRSVMSTNAELAVFTDQLLVDPPDRPGANAEGSAADGISLISYDGPPSFVRVLNAPIKVPAGGRAVVRIAIDAGDDWFTTNPGLFMPILSKGAGSFAILGYSDVQNGRMRCTISAVDASEGDKGRIVFTVIPPDGSLPLVDEADLEATERPQRRVKPAGKEAGKEMGGPSVEPITRDQWALFDFDDETVAKVGGDPTDPSLITIYVSVDYPPFVSALMAKHRANPDELEAHKENYCAHMAFLAWLQNQEEKTEVNQAEMRRAVQAWTFTTLSAD